MYLDVKQRDLYLRGMADRLEEANQLNNQLHRQVLTLQDEVTAWRFKYEDGINEANEVIKKLRRLLEEKNDEIQLLRLKNGQDFVPRESVSLDKVRELLLKNSELHDEIEKLKRELELAKRGTFITGSTGLGFTGKGNETTEVSSLRVTCASCLEGAAGHQTEQGVLVVRGRHA